MHFCYCCKSFGELLVTLEMRKEEHDYINSFSRCNLAISLAKAVLRISLEEEPPMVNSVKLEKDCYYKWLNKSNCILSIVRGRQSRSCINKTRGVWSGLVEHLQGIDTHVELLSRLDVQIILTYLQSQSLVEIPPCVDFDLSCYCTTCVHAHLQSFFHRECCVRQIHMISFGCAFDGVYLHHQIDLAQPATACRRKIVTCLYCACTDKSPSRQECLGLTPPQLPSIGFRPCTWVAAPAPSQNASRPVFGSQEEIISVHPSSGFFWYLGSGPYLTAEECANALSDVMTKCGYTLKLCRFLAQHTLSAYSSNAVDFTTVSVDRNSPTVVPIFQPGVASVLFPPRRLNAKTVILVRVSTDNGPLGHATDHASLTSTRVMRVLRGWVNRAVVSTGLQVWDALSLFLVECESILLMLLLCGLKGACASQNISFLVMWRYRQADHVNTHNVAMSTAEKCETIGPMPVYSDGVRNASRNTKLGAGLSSLSWLFLLVLWMQCDTIMGSRYLSDAASSTSNLPASEWNALYQLYNATNGANWQWSDDPTAGIHWNFSNPSVNNPCISHWQGINCSLASPYEHYHIVGINLKSYNLVGKLPSALSALLQLQHLDLSTNLLSGNIPESLGTLTQLRDLSLNYNQFIGIIPNSLGNLNQLQKLGLFTNALTGSIPESLGKLVLLEILFLSSNHLSGLIPTSLGNLIRLQRLVLSSNHFTGPIPASLGKLLQLYIVDLSSNRLTGTIPEFIATLTKLLSLNFDGNELTGTIPESLGLLKTLKYFDLGSNMLNGTLPDSLSNLTKLLYIDLYDNRLTGSIPALFGNLNQLQYLDVNTNALTGLIPSSLGNLNQLVYLELFDNKLIGSIPNSLGNLVQLRDLNLNTNHFTGSIPSFIPNLRELQLLDFSSNQLIGTIPWLGNLTKLEYLDFGNNRLTGTIPSMSGEHLKYLRMSNNLLGGTIPTLVRLPNLLLLLLQNNCFVGNLDGVFDPTKQLQVEMVVLNNNQLTGRLSEALFQLNLKTFSAINNCFVGPLPIDAICSQRKMMELIVDGLSSATSCRNKLFISAYTLQHAIGGSIPTCLFQLPNLTTLHLSGNGFTGSIPHDIELSDTLNDLSLSHNALTGSIPEQIQLRKWSNVDVSYNRLSGTLYSDFTYNGSVYLDNNRISGIIPSSFRTLRNISVLGSNMFSCSYDESDLPQHDPYKDQYHCGSNSFNSTYFAWLGAAVCASLVLSYFKWKYYVFRSLFGSSTALHNTNLHTSLSVVCQFSVACALYSITILLPLYAACSALYGTQTHQYAYQVSAVLTSGMVPFALNWIFWFLLVLILAIATKLLRASSAKRVIPKRSIQTELTTSSTSKWRTLMFIFAPYLILDCIVVVGANAAYVYVAVYKSRSLLLGVQTLLSVFKIVWGRWTLPYILTLLTKQTKFGKIQVVTEVMVNVLNNIVIPCLVVAVVSPNCFYYALVSAPAVGSTAVNAECTNVDPDTRQCLNYDYTFVPTSYLPPFSYNYQCSASLITYYAPAFVSMCIVSTFVTPLAQYACQWLYRRTTDGTLCHRLLGRLLPRIMKPVNVNANVATIEYLNTSGLMTTLVGTLAVILTFGVMFPPLCVALTVSLLATVYIFRVNVHRFIMRVPEQQRDHIVEILRAECNNVDSMHILKYSVWVLVTVSCWFYTLFLFDTLGDAVGFESAYWVLIVMPLMPLIMYVVYKVVCQYHVYLYGVTSNNVMEKDQHTEMKQGVELEMQTLGDSGESVVHNVLVFGARDTKNEEEINI